MKLKRWMAFALAAICLISLLPAAHGAVIDGEAFAQRLAQLQQIFKDGEYWNQYGENGSESSNPRACSSCSSRGRYSCNDCSDPCGVFQYGAGQQTSQCFGFTCKLANAVFGGNPDTWQKHTSASALQVGDIIYGDLGPMFNKSRVLNHAVFVTAITEDTVTFADCNWTGPCRIRWNKTVSRSKVVPSLGRGSVIYHAPNNKVGQISPMDITASKTVFVTKETVKLTCTYSGSASVNLYVKSKGDKFKWFSAPALKESISLKNLPQGHYRAVLTAADGRKSSCTFLIYTPAEMNFSDVKKKDWFAQNVGYVFTKGLFKGVSDKYFEPGAPMQRCMFVTVLGRLSGIEPDHSKKSKFCDVPTDTWYSGYVRWAAEYKIVSGTGKKTFDPFAPVTREQICKMMVTYAAAKGVALEEGVPLIFADKSSVSPWAVEYVDRCSGAGLISGVSKDGVLHFRPGAYASRAEVATIICNFASQM